MRRSTRLWTRYCIARGKREVGAPSSGVMMNWKLRRSAGSGKFVFIVEESSSSVKSASPQRAKEGSAMRAEVAEHGQTACVRRRAIG